MREHVRWIPYENLDIHLGREIRIDVESLVAKLVTGRRGGYCFTQTITVQRSEEDVQLTLRSGWSSPTTILEH